MEKEVPGDGIDDTKSDQENNKGFKGSGNVEGRKKVTTGAIGVVKFPKKIEPYQPNLNLKKELINSKRRPITHYTAQFIGGRLS